MTITEQEEFLKNKSKLKKIRTAILTYLDGTGWAWDPALSIFLDQVDSMLFGTGGNFEG